MIGYEWVNGMNFCGGCVVGREGRREIREWVAKEADSSVGKEGGWS